MPPGSKCEDHSSTHRSSSSSSSILLRFYFVRHGETVHNVQKLVIGQIDSPLTAKGIAQADALGQSLRGTTFWRAYSSDLSRAQESAKRILVEAAAGAAAVTKNAAGDDDDNNNNNNNDGSSNTALPSEVRVDGRLKELSKGVLQGFPKGWSLEEAARERERLQKEDENYAKDIPVMETAEEGWNRIYDWWIEVLEQALSSNGGEMLSSDKNEQVRNILVVSHSGLLRVFLQRLIGSDRLAAHPNARYDEHDGRFVLPNTSLTILEVDTSNVMGIRDSSTSSQEERLRDAVKIVKLTETQHYNLLLADATVTASSKH